MYGWTAVTLASPPLSCHSPRLPFQRIELRALILQLLASDFVVDDLRDVGRVIADALEILGDEQEVRTGGDRARIAHHVGEQFAERRVVMFVDLLIPAPDRLGAF